MSPAPVTHHFRAVLFSLAAFTLWTSSDTLVKLARSDGMPLHVALALTALGACALVLAVVFLRGDRQRLRPRHHGILAGIGILNLIGYACFVWAFPQMPLANFYSIVFVAPFTIAILAALFLRETLDLRRGLAILVGFGGVMIAVWPWGGAEGATPPLASGAVFVGMMMFAVQMVYLRHLGNRETRECIAFYPRSITLLAGGIAIAAMGMPSLSSRALLLALASGATSGCGWLCMAQAYKYAPASTVAPFQYVQIIVGIIYGYILWRDVPSWSVLAGAAVIIASGLFIAHEARRAARAS